MLGTITYLILNLIVKIFKTNFLLFIWCGVFNINANDIENQMIQLCIEIFYEYLQ